MKKSNNLCLRPILMILHCWLFVTMSAHANPLPPTGYTGAPPESQTCSSCHGGAGTGDVSLGFPAGFQKYAPGQIYALSVTVTDASKTKFGFSMVARADNNRTVNVGTLTAGSADTQAASAHVGSNTAAVGAGSRTFTVNWTAPATAGTGDVIFYISSFARSSTAITNVYSKVFTINELPPPAPVVNSTANSGAGSLRDAVSIATPGDTITFSPGLNGSTISLAGSQIIIPKNLTIDATALTNGITVSGNNLSRVFEISSSTTATLKGLTISGGTASSLNGGGIYNSGSLVVENSTISGNSTGFSGGGIYNNTGSLTMRKSTISGNSSQNGLGGGIYNNAGATTTLENCTLTENKASTGGAIRNFNGTTILKYCTVTGNTAPESNGGGVASAGNTSTTTQITSCIISANSISDLDLVSQSGTNSFTSGGFNLIGTGSGISAFNQTGDTTGISTPLLAPLCNNGGPTLTMHPLPGSRAIDGGGTTALTQDQRGLPRIVGSASDIGAVESGSNVRWATKVLGFSSQRTTTNRSAAQALGEPNTFPSYGDIVTAWSSLNANSQREFIELGYDNFTPINSVSIYETFSPGAVDGVSVRNAMTRLWVQVWSGTAASAGSTSRIFKVTFPTTSFPVDGVRLDLNSPAVSGFNEIDAVSISPSLSMTAASGLTSVFNARTILTNNVSVGGILVPNTVTTTSNGSAAAWQWTPQSSGWYDVNTFGSNFDTQVSVYTGSTGSTLIWLAGNDDAFPGTFASDHPQPNRSAMVLPFSAGIAYQFVISGGVNGASGGALQWAIHPASEPLPPAVETRTHSFNFPSSEYNAATALINTIVPIVPIAGFGTTEPYVQVVDSRSAVWNTVSNGSVTAKPFLAVGSSIRAANAHQLSSQPTLSAVVPGGFINPPSQTGPFITVVSARYPHVFGAGHTAICTDLRAEGGQGFGLTQMPRIHFNADPTVIAASQGGLKVAFQGLPIGTNTFGYTLKNAAGSTVRSVQGTTAEQLAALSPGLYSITLNEVSGYRIVVSYEGDGSESQRIANVVEQGNQLVNARRNLATIFPNSIDGTHLGVPNFVTQPVLSVSELVVKADTVTALTVKFVSLANGTDKIGYINVPAPQFEFLQQEDILGENSSGDVINPIVESAVLNLSNAAQTKVLVMVPEVSAPVGRVSNWQKTNTWISFRNFITSGDNSCYSCHTRVFGEAPGAFDPIDNQNKIAGGRPRVPWFRTDPSIPKTNPFANRIVPVDAEPYNLGIFNNPFGKALNHRMPINILANTGAPRRMMVTYAKRTWVIQQAAGSSYVPSIAITGGNLTNLTPGAKLQTVSFSANNPWAATALDSPWIQITSATSGASGSRSINLSFAPNPSARPRFGTVQIGDMFYTVVQPIEPPEITSLLTVASPRGFQYSVKAINGVTYNLEYSDTLNTGSWVEQSESVGSRATNQLNFDAVFPALPTRRFYRIKSEPAE